MGAARVEVITSPLASMSMGPADAGPIAFPRHARAHSCRAACGMSVRRRAHIGSAAGQRRAFGGCGGRARLRERLSRSVAS
jgi:hypothetical protein